ncbi:MAG: VWA domain-containing protein [Deltaproteobacteria bacterium]|nr:VWA domain-containing protein [Deltaproteobacteria bacterium]
MTISNFRRMTVASAALALSLAACGDDATAGAGDTGIELPTGGDSSGEDTAGADETATDGGVPNNCGASTFELVHQPTNIVLVLDKSGSMVENWWDHDGDPGTDFVTRWNSLHSSVRFITDQFDDGLNFGAVLFPAIDVPSNDFDIACRVDIEPNAAVAPGNGAAVLASLPPADTLDIHGGTPAGDGVTTALNHLRSLDPELPRAMILITDGAANCLSGATDNAIFELYDENLPALVAAAYTHEDIPTYVVGIDIVDEIIQYPADNPFVRLNEVAIAGGSPRPGQEKFYNANDEDELRSAISQVSSQIGCTIPLDEEPLQPDLLTIYIAGVEIPQVASCEGNPTGWRYTNPGGPYDEIELCANSCDDLHGVGSLSATYNCIPQG